MTAYIHIVIGVLSVKQCSFSSILNCTKLTTSCPTADQWLERGKLFNCPGNRKYVCLMAPGNELREGCIFNYTIQAGQTGCPYTKQCDIRTGQPLLVVYQNYLPCPPDHNGCPPRNHSGYSILEIYKYARCQGRNTSDKSSVSPDKVTGAPTTTTPDTILHYENWKLNTLSIAVGLLFLLVVFYLVFRGKCKGRSEYKSLGIIQAENNLYRENKSTINQEQLAEMGAIPHEQQHLLLIKENSSPDTTVETELPNFTYSTKKTVSKKKDQQHLRHTHYSSSEDSYSSQTPLLPDETQQTYFSLSSHKPQPDSSFIVSEKDTQLYQAASDGDIETLKKLIDARADVNAKAFFQDTPLHIAASNGHIDIVKILIDARADVNAKDLDQDTPLHKAASNGHSDTVKMLIDANADANAMGKVKDTPLHRAALNGKTATVKILIDANVEVNAKNMYEDTPLYKAAFNSHSDIVNILIDVKADANVKGLLRDTPLHRAAINGDLDTVKILIDANVDVNAKDKNEDTPLIKAALHGHTDVVKRLIDAKADVDAKDSNQVTPLHAATYIGHSDIVRMLIDAKADVNAKLGNQVTPLYHAVLKGNSDVVRMLIDAKSDVNAKDENQVTPLHHAVLKGNSDVVRMLIDAKSDVNAKDKNQITPLHTATYIGHSDIVRMLIDAKADVNAKVGNQVTPLHMATYIGHSDVVMMLVDAKADVNAKAENQITPFHKAAMKGNSDVIRMLIDAKSDVNAKDEDQNTSLHMAAFNGHSDIVRILIDLNADVNAINRKQDTPLHRATVKGHSDTVRMLIDAKSDVNAKGWRRYTPLHIAAINGHSDIVKILIHVKADVNATDWTQNTPLQWAALNGHSDTVRMLIDAKSDVNAKGWNRATPLHKATISGHSDIVRILIDANADVNAKGCEKDTPLHEAARYDHDGIIRILLSSAADFSIRNINGKTAEELGNPKSKQVFSDCLEKVPREIKRLGVDAVRQFLKSLNEDAVAINVVSCMFVGHVGVGKTTLVNRILGMPRKKTKITNDIDLHMGKIFANTNTGEWHIEDEQTEKIIGLNDFTQINVWDFAGKMMYYTMHQGHLSPRRLYCLVFNASLGLDSMVDDHSVDLCDKDKISVKDYIEFWVTTITTYVQSDVRGFPRIALVGTHIDKLQDTWKISQIIEEIKSKFQPLVDTGQLILHEDLFINACDMNAETKRKLRDIILSCGKSYPEYGQMIPRSWNDLHQTFILRKSEKVISFDQFEQINSQMKKTLNEKELILCIEYFHSLGYFLFFPDEDLKDHIVLDPTWITNAILSFITCSNSTSENWRVKKWLQMQITGKIEHAYFEEVLLENNVEARDSHHLHKVMKRLDLASEPKVYNAEGFEERQNYFYMPCIINRYISPDALSLTGNQDAVHLSFSFSTVIPPAVYNRLVASSLSLWPIFESHIYNGLIILRSGPFHLIAFRKEQMQINISVVHLQDQRQINASLCRTIVQFVEQRLTWILSIYNTSTVERKSLFHITYNSTAAERLNARKTEEEESENCEDCEDRWESDVTQDNYVPDDLFLMRVASRLTDKDIYPLAEKVYNHKRFADDLESDYTELKTSDIAWLILIEWRRQEQDQERTPDLMGLRLVLHQAKINPHVLCRVFSQKDEHPFLLDPDYLRTDVHSELLHAVADRISSEYIHVGLQLGLKADGILKLMKNFKGRTVGLIRAMLQEWYDKNKKKGHVKVVQLATALLNAKSDISVFYEFGKQRFHVRYGQNATEKLGLEILYRRT